MNFIKKKFNWIFDKRLGKTKAVEIQLSDKFDPDYNYSFMIRSKGDHAGLRWGFQLSKYFFEFSIYDVRHWDYDNDCFVK